MKAIYTSLHKVLALSFALSVTIGLLYTMQLLIRMTKPEFEKNEPFVMPNFVHISSSEEIKTIKRPKKPPRLVQKPVVIKQSVRPSTQISDVVVNLETKVAINRTNSIGLSPGDGEYLPIVKIAPVYPRRAAQRCKQGFVIVGFTVTSNGSVRDPYVVESSDKLFEKSALKAVQKFKYKPRTVDGVAIEVADVKNRITYKMDGCKR